MRPLLALALVLLAGCDVLAPVIVEQRNPPGRGGTPCELAETCAQLGDPAPTTVTEAEVQAPSPICSGPLAARTLVLDGERTVMASSLECTQTTVVVVLAPGEHPPTPTLHVTGGPMRDAVLAISSDDAITELVLDAPAIDRATLELEGAIRARIVGARIAETAVHLRTHFPIAPPELLLDGVSAADLRVDASGAIVRARDATLRQAVLDARTVAVERGSLRAVLLRGEHVELLDVVAASVRIDASRFIAAGGTLTASFLSRCDVATLALTHVASSRFAACAEPIDLEAASMADVVLEGDVTGRGTLIHGGVLGGASVTLEEGTLQHVALCDVSALETAALECFSCAPDAPGEVCAGMIGNAVRCPGLCQSQCDHGPSAASVAESCGE